MIIKDTKGKNLQKVADHLSIFQIPDFVLVKRDKFDASPVEIANEIAAVFGNINLAIRSSASDEDSGGSTMAGKYESLLNIDSSDQSLTMAAIQSVFDSYQRSDQPISPSDEVIVQEMVGDVSMSGVIFTHDLNTGAPYYVVNYDDQSGQTDAVTSGGVYANRTLYIHRGALDSLRSPRFSKLMSAVSELEDIVGSQFLDIEFAIGVDNSPFLLQVRSITTQPNWNRAISSQINDTLKGIQDFVHHRLKPVFGVYGESTVLGQMPDWNPAELIGRAPRALAFSLYKYLITDNAWREGRAAMDYAVPIGQPLMISLAGQPFIDTRLSFHSYLPASLPPVIAEKLVNCWVSKLKSSPHLHDKIEFEVAITTYSFDLDHKFDHLVGDALSDHEKDVFRRHLLAQFRSFIRPESQGSVRTALEKINSLETIDCQDLMAKSESLSSLNSIFFMCQQEGTIPFAILARHGFIAKTLLDSMLTLSIIDHSDVVGIQSSVNTVAGELVDAMHNLQEGTLSHDSFMERFGHLRPGTYDILSKRYDQMKDFCNSPTTTNQSTYKQQYQLSADKHDKINKLLKSEGIENLNSESLLDYILESIAGREYGKLVFTRLVSNALEFIAEYGEKHGLSRDDMSYIPIDCLLDIASASTNTSIENRLRTVANKQKDRHQLSMAIRLPQVLFDEAGVHVIPFQVSMPNFITQKKVISSLIVLEQDSSQSISNSIVLIENADPGFDWIFSKNIVGLITKYGGANSHMAIRCAEFGIPAAIGCGEQRFEALLSVKTVSLDCSACTIIPL